MYKPGSDRVLGRNALPKRGLALILIHNVQSPMYTMSVVQTLHSELLVPPQSCDIPDTDCSKRAAANDRVAPVRKDDGHRVEFSNGVSQRTNRYTGCGLIDIEARDHIRYR